MFERRYDVRTEAAAETASPLYKDYDIQLPDNMSPPGYKAFATRLDNPTKIRLVPNNASIPFYVVCSYDVHMEKIHFCTANSSYAFDRFIDLRSRLYFPGDYMENGDFFRDVARQMHEIAVCLDVTSGKRGEPIGLSKTCDKAPTS